MRTLIFAALSSLAAGAFRGDSQIPLHGQFETSEHAYLGNVVDIRLSETYSIKGIDFRFKPYDREFSYGQIVALAGDYFGAWSLTECPLQVSDEYEKQPEASVLRFKELAASMLKTAQGSLMRCLDGALEEIDDKLCVAVKAGRDPAQIYKRISDDFDTRLGLCTIGYLQISLCNWDHFGVDAENSYRAGHKAALQEALEARKSHDLLRLRHAYFYEAYAQHFLTDLFSAGHLRAPRRVLHQGLQGLDVFWPADQLNRMMHDEDCGAGLWVTNDLGESWVAYGDKELTSMKSNLNVDQAVAACQLGLDEVWGAFSTGSSPSVDEYKALKKAPNSKLLDHNVNFSPMFFLDASTNKTIYRREDLASRSDLRSIRYNRDELGQAEYKKMLDEVNASGPRKDPLLATVSGLVPEVDVTQYRALNSTRIIVNHYSTLSTRNYQNRTLSFCKVKPAPGRTKRSWNLVNQSLVKIPSLFEGAVWSSLQYVPSDEITIVYGFKESGQHIWSCFLGLRGSQLLWTWESSAISKDFNSGEILVGKLDRSSESLAIVQRNSGRLDDMLSVYHFEDGVDKPPKLKGEPWMSTKTGQTLVYNLPGSHAHDLHIATEYIPGRAAMAWHITFWTENYETRQYHKLIEQQVLNPTWLLPYGDGKLIRISHHLDAKLMRLDVLTLSLDEANQPDINSISTQIFQAPWASNASIEVQVAPLTSSDVPSIVFLLTDQKTAEMTTVVFPPNKEGGFKDPITSKIESPNEVPSFVSPSLKSLGLYSVPYVYREIRQRSPGGLLQLFDNYGVLGARLLGNEVFEKLKFRAIGQTPAIAGQVSSAIGFVVVAK